ncbi:LPS translocon maturation chaperone LptM [Marinospirillum sp.]
MVKKILKPITLALLALLLITGCGQKGNLYLPQPDTKLMLLQSLF